LYLVIPFDEVEKAKILPSIKEFAARIEPQFAPQPFAAHIGLQTAPQVTPQTAPQVTPQTAPIYKLNEINKDFSLQDSQPRAPDVDKMEFGGVFLSIDEMQTLEGKFQTSRSVFELLHFCVALRKKKDAGYIPSGTDFEELLRMVDKSLVKGAEDEAERRA
jgi:hypothetical protein